MSGRAKVGVYRSAATAVLLQWSMRFIGLISILVLARLLTPEDFGVIGIAMATIAIIEILGALGLRQALLRIAEPSREHMDTAWTLQMLICFALCLLILAAAPVAGWAYDDARLVPVIAVLSTRFVFIGLVNIGVVDFDRNMQFGTDMRMRLVSRLGSFVLTLAAALYFRSYWALVVGMVAQTALLTAASYAMHPYRPRWCLKERAALLGFSLWMLLSWTAQTAQQQVERLVAATFGGAHLAGLYSASKDLSEIFTQEITTALNRVTFVTIASSEGALHEDRARLARIVGCYAIIAAPLGFGLTATAENTVVVLLGWQWVQAVPLLQIIAVYSALLAVYRVIASSLTAAGFAQRSAILSVGGALLTGLLCAAAGIYWRDAVAVAAAALAGNLLLLMLGLADFARKARIGLGALAMHVIRPFAAAALMCAVLRLLPITLGLPVADLLLAVVIGAPLYLLFLAAIWVASGKPDSAEAEGLALVRTAATRLPWAQPTG